MSAALAALLWPEDRLEEALRALVHHSGLSRDRGAAIGVPFATAAGADPGPWLEQTITALGAEAEEVDTAYAELDDALSRLSPGVARLRLDGQWRWAILLRSRGRKVVLITPHATRASVNRATLRDLIAAEVESPALPQVDRILEIADTSRRARPHARRALLQERLGAVRVAGLWILRTAPGAGFWHLVGRSNMPRLMGVLLTSHIAQYALMVGAWVVFARGLGNSEWDRSWVDAWTLLIATGLVFRIVAGWAAGRLGVEIGTLLKRRLLIGSLHVGPDATRSRGVGELLARVIETEVVELLGLSGGILAATSLVELGLATWLMFQGVAGGAHAGTLAAIVLAALVTWRMYVRRMVACADRRLEITNKTLDVIVGHQTRLAQQSPEHWHDAEDVAVTALVHESSSADRIAVVSAALPRIWLAVAIAWLGPSLMAFTATPQTLAYSLGGILLAYRCLVKAVSLLSSFAAATHAWQRVSPLLEEIVADSTPAAQLGQPVDADADGDGPRRLIVDAEGLAYRYPNRAEHVLKSCDLKVLSGDRVLLQGASGSGKSTLCALLAGIRAPEAGVILVDGLDRGSLGANGWRKRVATAPQFHDNHVFSASLAFNLLMGRDWPPRRGDVQAAEAVCRNLGLGPLIDRMPSGMLQMVGDMGWQLSHGERSRLFVARTLLQRASVIILDESFAALDPVTLQQCARTMLSQSSALIVIAHP